MTLQVSITGEPGCGKTTVAKLVAQNLEAEYLSTGSIQREIAAKMGISTLELNKLSETDKSIDEQIDAHTKALGKSQQSIVIDSRLAWRFLPGSLKVFLVCPPSVAANRVFNQNRAEENFDTKEQAIESLILRHESEKIRFAKYYGAALGNLRNYDLIIDTSNATPQVIAGAICAVARKREEIASLPTVLISPKSLIPTLSIAELPQSSFAPLRDYFGVERLSGGDVGLLDVCRVAGAWAIVDGHKRTALALKHHAEYLRARLLGMDDEVLDSGVTARSLLENEVTWSRINKWEEAFGFKFTSYPSFLPSIS